MTPRAAIFSEWARRYTELGWALITLEGKVPRSKKWESTKPDPDPRHAAGLWAYWGERWNMGVVLGPSGLAVVEADTEEAAETLMELLRGCPPTPIARSGRGLPHVYFRDPGGLQKMTRDGLELRVGRHQMVVPPSVHPETGVAYAWEAAP